MANEVKDKFTTSAALTITLAGLADTNARQSTLVDNATTKYQDLLVYVKATVGTGPLANSFVEVYAIRGDDDATTEHLTDGAGASDAAITIKNAQLLGVVRVTAVTDNLPYYGEFLFHRPGPTWGIAIKNESDSTLHATGSNHWARWIGLNPEVQ